MLLRIGTQQVEPESKTHGFVEMEGYAGPFRIRFPVLIARGRKDSPLFTLTAAQHGREVQGIEVVRRVFDALRPEKMQGSVVAFPVANPLAVRMWQHDFPTEIGRYTGHGGMGMANNLNRHWPGDRNGTLPERMCRTMWDAAIGRSAFHIDLHGWSDNSVGLAWTSEPYRDVLRAFGYPVNMVYPAKTDASTRCVDEACELAGIPWITIELPPQNRLWERSVRHGVRGVSNVLKYIGILEGELEFDETRHFFTPECVEHKFVAESYGLVSADVPIGTMLGKGQRFGAIYSLDTLEAIQELAAPEAGLLFNVGGWLCEALNPVSVVAPGMNVALVREIAESLSRDER